MKWKLDKRLDDRSLTPANQAQILNWCSRFGLLGILPQTALTIELPPPVRLVSNNSFAATMEKTEVVKYMRVNGDWIRQTLLVSYDYQDPSVFSPVYNQVPSAPFQELTIGQSSVPMESLLPVFFSDLQHKLETSTNFEFPKPLSPEFWSVYSERVDDFLSFAMAFVEAVEPVLADRNTANLAKFQEFLGPAGICLSYDAEGRVRQRSVCPSLLSSFACMALQDASAGRRLLLCEGCGGPFVTSAYQSRYCSLRCAWKHRKRKARAPRSEQSTAGTRSIGRKSEPEPPPF